MRMGYLFLVFIVVVGSLVLFSQCTYNETHNYYYNPIVKNDLTVEERHLLDLINNHRTNLGLNKLIPEMLASEVCEIRNVEDIDNNVAPNHNGWNEMIQDSQAVEGDQILAYNFYSVESLFNAYLTSPHGHRQVIEKEDRTHIGISLIDGRNYIIVVKHISR
jgi:hypothetical protein